ncbi:hypothetical protein BHM03_00058674 [Ensete ventricosum]|nr:hypothetical protein BHM03_00058674 [Ensete ventricosum]
MGSRTSTVSLKNTTIINFARSRSLSRVSIGFHASSQKFIILAIPDVLAHLLSTVSQKNITVTLREVTLRFEF